jgi:hypothetical protein
MNYTITAKLNGSTSRIGFSASDDTEATFDAISLILNKEGSRFATTVPWTCVWIRAEHSPQKRS